MEENIQLTDLTVIGTLNDVVLLAVLKEDVGTENPKCLKIDLGKGEFHVGETEKFTKFAPYDTVSDDENIQKFYRSWIYRKLPNKKIMDLLIGFTKATKEFEKDS